MHPSTRFRFLSLRLFFLFAVFLTVSGLHFSACQPYPLEFYIRQTPKCSQDTSSAAVRAAGLLDLQIKNTYQLGFTFVNSLAGTGNPLTLAQEINTLTIKSADIFLEFPDNFSLKGSDPALYPKEKPLKFPLSFILEPTLVGGNIQGVGGAVGAGIVTTLPGKDLIDFPLIPFDTGLLLAKQSVAEIGRDRYLQVVVQITFNAENFVGTKFSSPPVRFPILLCKGCLDIRKDLASPCDPLNVCTGQDGNLCDNKPPTTP